MLQGSDVQEVNQAKAGSGILTGVCHRSVMGRLSILTGQCIVLLCDWSFEVVGRPIHEICALKDPHNLLYDVSLVSPFVVDIL